MKICMLKMDLRVYLHNRWMSQTTNTVVKNTKQINNMECVQTESDKCDTAKMMEMEFNLCKWFYA